MILVSFLLLLAAIVLLVIGIVQESVPLIWSAMGTAAVSAVILYIGNRRAIKREEAEAAGALPAFTPPGAYPVPSPQAVAPGMADVGAHWAATDDATLETAAPMANASAWTEVRPVVVPQDQPAEAPADDVSPFEAPGPGSLDEEETSVLAVADARAEGTDAADTGPETDTEPPAEAPVDVTAEGPTVAVDGEEERVTEATVSDATVSLEQVEAVAAEPVAPEVVEEPGAIEPAGPPEASAPADQEVVAAGEEVRSAAEAAAPAETDTEAPPSADVPAAVATAPSEAVPDSGGEGLTEAEAPASAEPELPVAGYASMKAAEAQKAVAKLQGDADALLTVWEYESAHANRRSVLERIENLYMKAGDMPIEGYDGAAVGALKPLLPQLIVPELKAVRAYEEAHANRKSILAEIDRLLARRPTPSGSSSP